MLITTPFHPGYLTRELIDKVSSYASAASLSLIVYVRHM